MNQEEQQLLAIVLDLFASEFAEKAILRGGMVLKVLGSARYTNDLDYVFVPYRSKKEVTAKILACLKKLKGSTVAHSLNSQCLRILLKKGNASIQIEVKVALEVKSSVVSTKLFSDQHNLPKRLLHIADHTVSMANKLAAWNEHRLARDLYDIWFFLQMGIAPDLSVLSARLAKPYYSPLVKQKDYFDRKSPAEFFEFLRAKVKQISDKEIEQELSDYLLPHELAGLAPIIRSGLVKLK